MEIDPKIIHNFFEGNTTNTEEQILKDWLEESPENKRRFMEERKLFDMLLLRPDCLDIPINTNKETTTHNRKKLFFREFLKIASIIAITLIGCLYYIKIKDDRLATAMQVVTVPAGQRANLTLPDGTNIWLNAQTRIEYPLSFNSNHRTVKLDGQAYFEVVHDKNIPFVVETVKGSIEVLGTKFDVMAYSDSKEFETALMEGQVKVDLASDKTQCLILEPDTKAYLDNGKLKSIPMDNYNSYRWREGLICFDNEPFIDIMEDLERSFGTKIIVQNTQISKLVYTGKFRFSDGLDYALRVLQEDHKFSFERNKENNIIYIK